MISKDTIVSNLAFEAYDIINEFAPLNTEATWKEPWVPSTTADERLKVIVSVLLILEWQPQKFTSAALKDAPDNLGKIINWLPCLD